MRGRARHLAAVPAVIAIAAVAGLAPFGGPSASAAAARRGAPPGRRLVALSEQQGAVEWRVRPRARGGSLTARLVTHGLVLAEEIPCPSTVLTDETAPAALVALDARTGRERWRAPGVRMSQGEFGRIDPPGPGVDTVPVESPVGGSPALLDVRTGQLQGPMAGVPVAASGELLIVAALDAFRASASVRGKVTALDRRTGAPMWTANLSAALFSVAADPAGVAFAAGPIADPGTALGMQGGIGVVEAGDGHARWAALPRPLFGIDVAAGRVVFQTSQQLQALDLASGRPAWGVPVDGQLDPGRTAGDTLLVVRGSTAGAGAAPNQIDGFAAGTGARRWRHTVPGELLDPAVATDRVVAVGTRDRIVAFDPTRGRVRWTRTAPGSATGVVAGGGRVYVSGGCSISTG